VIRLLRTYGWAAATLGLCLPLTGCLTLTPIGPFANQLGGNSAQPVRSATGALVSAPQDAPSPSQYLATPPPPPMPTLLVTPGEVSPQNGADTIQRLLREMEADRQALEQMPVTAEVSVVGR